MSLSISNNITALNAWRNLKQTDSNISKTMEKLSSGLRINRAADDPAGLVISEKMRAQLNGLDTAVKNSEKAVNMVQTAEAALDKVGKLLVKIRQLAVDTANKGVNDTSMLSANQAELDEAIKSITRIADYTQFGTKKLLNGELGSSVTAADNDVAAGATVDLVGSTTQGNDEKTVTLNVTTQATRGQNWLSIDNVTAADAVISVAGSLVVDGMTISIVSTDTGTTILGKITDNASLSEKYTVTLEANTAGDAFGLKFVNKLTFGSGQAIAQVSAGTGDVGTTAMTSANGIDLAGTFKIGSGAAATLDKGKGLVLADANGNHITLTSTANAAATSSGGSFLLGTLNDNSAVFQIGANELQQVRVSVESTKAVSLGKYATYGDDDKSVTAYTSLEALKSGAVLKSGTADQLAQAIGVIDKAIDDVASLRGSLGAVQSDNLQVQLDSLRVSYENLQASESTIRDADMTSEMATFTKFQIMMQAGVAMLAQANQQPNTLLQLLR